jgi:hypothetical protein
MAGALIVAIKIAKIKGTKIVLADLSPATMTTKAAKDIQNL